MLSWLKKFTPGIGFCFGIALVSQFLGQLFPIIGGPVLALVIGIFLGIIIKDTSHLDAGLTFTSKKVLQYAVILLGFGLNLGVVWETGKQSLPIILSTISIALLVAYMGHKYFGIKSNIATLVGVGSSICGGSAIAATAPVIEAAEEEVAQAISVIFFFNLVAALIFPSLGQVLGFSSQSGHAFGLFAGTAINDTSSVTAAASTWDNLYQLGSQTLDTAVTVKLTRTLAIIPITMGLSVLKAKKEKQGKFSIKNVFPTFILFFIFASFLTTIWTNLGLSSHLFLFPKTLSKFFITMAMFAIGLRTNLFSLIKNGQMALFLGFLCWISITILSLILQKYLGFL